MIPVPWGCLKTDGVAHESPAPGCVGLIPLFETKEQAEEWAGPNVEILLLSKND